MKTVDTYRFWTPEVGKKRPTLTRYYLTLEEGAKRYPGCKPDLNSRQARNVSDEGEVTMIPAGSRYGQ